MLRRHTTRSVDIKVSIQRRLKLSDLKCNIEDIGLDYLQAELEYYQRLKKKPYQPPRPGTGFYLEIFPDFPNHFQEIPEPSEELAPYIEQTIGKIHPRNSHFKKLCEPEIEIWTSLKVESTATSEEEEDIEDSLLIDPYNPPVPIRKIRVLAANKIFFEVPGREEVLPVRRYCFPVDHEPHKAFKQVSFSYFEFYKLKHRQTNGDTFYSELPIDLQFKLLTCNCCQEAKDFAHITHLHKDHHLERLQFDITKQVLVPRNFTRETFDSEEGFIDQYEFRTTVCDDLLIEENDHISTLTRWNHFTLGLSRPYNTTIAFWRTNYDNLHPKGSKKTKTGTKILKHYQNIDFTLQVLNQVYLDLLEDKVQITFDNSVIQVEKVTLLYHCNLTPQTWAEV
jgi:hypothetical protein